MQKSSLFSDLINGTNDKRKYTNVTTLVVSNFDSSACTIVVGGIERTIPAIDSTYNVPVAPFEFSDNGNYFDVEIFFKGTHNNTVVDLARVEIINPKNCS